MAAVPGAGLTVVAILVDRAIWPWRDRVWAHLASDESHEELHRFADELGLRREWFQGDHYDVPADVRERALQHGAQPVTAAELVRRLRAAGLRRNSRWVTASDPGSAGSRGPASA